MEESKNGAHPQINVRAPESSRELFLQLAEMFRRDASLIACIELIVDQHDVATLAERVLRLERQVTMLRAAAREAAHG